VCVRAAAATLSSSLCVLLPHILTQTQRRTFVSNNQSLLLDEEPTSDERLFEVGEFSLAYFHLMFKQESCAVTVLARLMITHSSRISIIVVCFFAIFSPIFVVSPVSTITNFLIHWYVNRRRRRRRRRR
jgi:hypothetical protein